jgi:predicted GIY-YIG superfamily endonuclease
MTMTHNGTQSLPAKAGVYIIRDANISSYTLYVGIASNIKSRLNSQHHILKYCRDRNIPYTIDYELEPNEKKRKKREHQLISELDAKLNDGGIPSEFSNPEPSWQSDIDSLVSQLRDEDGEILKSMHRCEAILESWKWREFCYSWIRTAWEDFDSALHFLLYGRKFKEYSTFIDQVDKSPDYLKYKVKESDFLTVVKCRGTLLGSSNLGDDNPTFWIEEEPAVQGVGSTIILDDLHKAINGESFDLDSIGVEERFLSFLPYLNPDIANQWEPFKRASNEKKHWHTGDIIQDFCDHALMWSYYNELMLFHSDLPKDLLFTKFFLENPYRQKSYVEEIFKQYVPTTDFVTAARDYFKNYRPQYQLQYRVLEGYDSRRDYLCDSIELRLIWDNSNN